MRRKTLLKFMMFALCLVSITSCNLNRIKNQADFSDFGLDDASIDARWGIPVINAEFVLGDYLNVLDSMEFIDTTGGAYRFVYEIDKDTLVKVSDLLDTIDDITLDGISTNFNFDIPGGVAGLGITLRQRVDNVAQFSFAIEDFSLEQVSFTSGSLSFDSIFLDVDTNRVVIDTIILYLDQFTNNQGDTLSVLFDAASFANGSLTLPIDGYHLTMPIGNQLSVSAYFAVTIIVDSVSSTEVFNVGFAHFELTNLNVGSVTGRIATQEVEIAKSLEFNFLPDSIDLDGAISIMNPNFIVSTLNNTGVDAQVIIDKAEFSDSGNNPWELFQNPSDKTITISPSDDFVDNTINIDEIKFSTDYNRLDFEARGILSPDGLSSVNPFVITPSTMIGFGLKVDVPLSLKIDDLTYSMDILDNLSLGEKLEADDIDFIDTLALKLHINHNLPVSFTPQLYMYDSTSVLIDSLFTSNQFITRSYGEEVQNVIDVFVTGNKIKRLLDTKKIEMTVKLDTNDDEAQIDKNAYIKVKAGARLTYSSLPNILTTTSKEDK